MQSRTGVTVLVAPGPEVTMAHADLAARARIARGHEPGALLVGRNDQRHRLAPSAAALLCVVAEHRVVGRQDGAAAVAENGRYALVGEHLDDHLRAGHLLAGERMSGVRRARGVTLFHDLFNQLIPRKSGRD